jgi:hypothetical protein
MPALPRPSIVRLLGGVAFAMMVSAAPSALGQVQPTPSSVMLDDLFSGDSVDVNPEAGMRLVEAARQAQAPGGCPIGSLTIVVPDTDPIFQNALAGARRDALLNYLDRHGVEANRLFTDTIIQGTENKAWLELNLDREAPTLNTTSEPTNGSRVKPGDEITITMVARDDADPKPYQTGIKTLQLVADSEGRAFLVSENYEPCTEPSEHTIQFTYTVPSDAPPVVRLSALADDHAGHTATDAGEFPLTDWYGRIEWSFHAFEDTSRGPNENRAETKYDGYADIDVDYDGQGNLTGRLVGSQKVDVFWWGYPHGSGEVCSGSAPETPVTARVLGSYTPGANVLSLYLADVQAAIDVPWSGGGPTLDCSGGPLQIDNGPTLEILVRSLQAAGDGSYRAEFEQADATQSMKFSMTLKPAPD